MNPTYGSWEQQGGIDEDGDPTYVYFNALIVNNRTEVSQDLPDPRVEFQETRQRPLISNASKYDFSIVRANMNGPGKDLPLFLPTICIGPVDNPTQDVNKTIYSVSLQLVANYTVGGNDYTATFTTTQFCIWTPETLDLEQAPVPIPETTVTGQDVSTRYYWAYTYSHWLQIVNTAFEACITDLQAQFAANYTAPAGWNLPGPAPTLQTTAPILSYNPSTNLFSLYADRVGFGGASRTSAGTVTDENFRLFFNANTYGLFANFNNLYVNLPNGLTNEILIYPILFSNILTTVSPPAPAAKTYWIMNQDYPSTSTLWSPIESIVFTSIMLPLAYEGIGAPIKFGTSQTGQSGNIEAAFTPIITDIALTNESASDYRQFIQYIPSAEYRMTSFLSSKSPISNIDIQIFWKNRLDGKLYPLTMFNGSSVSVKIMFRRRGIYS
jgi:hypothetical protein